MLLGAHRMKTGKVQNKLNKSWYLYVDRNGECTNRLFSSFKH